MLGTLKPDDQARLIEAMTTIEHLLGAKAEAKPQENPNVILRQPKHGDFAGSCRATPNSTRRNMVGAIRSKACARKSSPIRQQIRHRTRALLDRRDDGENVGCVMLVKDEEPAQRASAC